MVNMSQYDVIRKEGLSLKELTNQETGNTLRTYK